MATDLPPGVPDLRARRSVRTVKNALMIGLFSASVVVAIVPLVAVLATVVSHGGRAVFAEFPRFLTDRIPRARQPGPGMGPAVTGTLMITSLAALIAIPAGILGAVYLNEYGKQRPAARVLRFFSYVMAGVPSIVMGMFVYVVWTLRFGYQAFGGALALALLMLPIVIRSVEEMLKLVPDHLREASYALGTRKSRTILTVVLPAALPGVISGCLLAVARAAGETAPLIFTIGFVTAANPNPFEGANTSLSVQIFRNAVQPFQGAVDRAWGAALVLIAITFSFTIVARAVAARFAITR